MISLARLTAPGAAKLARDPRVVIFLPLGAIEQHGPHLPLLARRRGAGANPAAEWHSGELETAFMLSVDRKLVRESLAKQLSPAWFDFRRALARGARNFRRLGPGGAGHFGWPAAARAKTGRDAIALRSRLIARRLLQVLGKRSHPLGHRLDNRAGGAQSRDVSARSDAHGRQSMLLDRVSRQPFDALLDHADGPRRRSRVRGPPPLPRRAFTTSSRFCCCPMNEGEA